MSKRIMRKGKDNSTAHMHPSHEVTPGAWWEGSISANGSHNVFVNGSSAMRINDWYDPHQGYKHVQAWWPDGTPYAKQVPDWHSPPLAAQGSTTVFINGRGAHLVGHDVDCPIEYPGQSSHAWGPGSPNVFVGG